MVIIGTYRTLPHLPTSPTTCPKLRSGQSGCQPKSAPTAIYGEELFVDMILPYPALSNGVVYLHRTSQGPSGSLNVVRVDGVAGPCGFKIPLA